MQGPRRPAADGAVPPGQSIAKLPTRLLESPPDALIGIKTEMDAAAEQPNRRLEPFRPAASDYDAIREITEESLP